MLLFSTIIQQIIIVYIRKINTDNDRKYKTSSLYIA